MSEKRVSAMSEHDTHDIPGTGSRGCLCRVWPAEVVSCAHSWTLGGCSEDVAHDTMRV